LDLYIRVYILFRFFMFSKYVGMLELCDKWKLTLFKDHIEKSFFQNHIAGLNNFDGNLKLKNFELLKLTDKSLSYSFGPWFRFQVWQEYVSLVRIIASNASALVFRCFQVSFFMIS